MYTNGIFHSQYNPSHIVGGNLWDLMWLPVFFAPQTAIKRVLVLGVGGGAVMRSISRLFPGALITGVDIDAQHIYIAQRFFGVKGSPYTLIKADAIKWLAGYKGPGFDYILEDLYSERDGEPWRAIQADQQWLNSLSSHLAPGGVLALNFTTLADFKHCSWHHSAGIRQAFKHAYQLSMPAYENRVMVMGEELVPSATFKAGIQAHPLLSNVHAQRKLKYHLRRISS